MYNEENGMWYAPIMTEEQDISEDMHEENDEENTENKADLNFTIPASSTSKLPYIKIKDPVLKLLMDTGNSISMIDPKIVKQYFPRQINNEISGIRTVNGNVIVKQFALIPCFNELKLK